MTTSWVEPDSAADSSIIEGRAPAQQVVSGVLTGRYLTDSAADSSIIEERAPAQQVVSGVLTGRSLTELWKACIWFRMGW